MATINTSRKIYEKTKRETQKLFKDLELNLSMAINIFLKHTIREKGILFYINSLFKNSKLDRVFKETI